MQCDQCAKWRLVQKQCLPALGRGDSFFKERATDMDWELWMQQASARYAAVVASHADGI